MAEYLLYGEKMIEDDSSLERFAQCVIDGVPVEDLKMEKGTEEYAERYMELVRCILEEDIARTDIDYPGLMEKYAPEIGKLLFDMENAGYDPSSVNLTFFGDRAAECFNTLVAMKIWLMAFCKEPEEPAVTRLKAVNISWDTDDGEDLAGLDLPAEVLIPEGMEDVDEISDYLSDLTGFCHGGFGLAEA